MTMTMNTTMTTKTKAVYLSSTQKGLLAAAALMLTLSATACGPQGEGGPYGTSAAVSAALANPPQQELSLDEAVAVATALIANNQDAPGQIQYALSATEARQRWSNLPAAIYRQRNGVRLGDMNAADIDSVLLLLRALSSDPGFRRLIGILQAEAELAAGSPRAERLRWGADNYWLAFFGAPSMSEPWALQFNGHHLALNLAMNGDTQIASPVFLGIEPAVLQNGSTPLDDAIRIGRWLISDMLEEPQREATRLGSRSRDMRGGPGDDEPPPPVQADAPGQVRTWSSEAKEALMETINLWLAQLPPEQQSSRRQEIRAGLDDTVFFWHGDVYATDGNLQYRIQGPTLLIEFSVQGDLGDDGGHYHSVYRNLSDDYGTSLLGQ